MCILRCIYPSDGSESFRIYLFLSRHYPIVSQLFVRFKLLVLNNNERLKFFQTRIQTIFDETSYKCFYHGQLCLHTCLLKLKHFFYSNYKQERLSSTRITNKSNKKYDESINNLDLDSSNGITNNKNSNRISYPLSLSTHTNNNQILSNGPFIRANHRTCGARFASGTYLLCFGRLTDLQHHHQEPSSAPPILYNITDGLTNRPSPLHIRSTSLTVTKSRGCSGTDDQSSK
jgi:hypothetical protein